MAQQWALGRPPRTPQELWWAVYAMWGVKIPTVQVCEHHTSPFEAFHRAYFASDPVAVWWASRGYGGKSFLLSVLSLSEAAWLTANISLLGGSGAQSLNVHEHTESLWFAPNAPKRLLTNRNKFGSTLSNGGSIRSLMASQTSVRGPHPQRLRLDEIDEMDIEILRAAQGQPMRKRGIETQTVMSSTWQYPDKTMRMIMDEANEKGWPIFSWCYRETSNTTDGWLAPDEVQRKKVEIPKAMWDAEYELQEPNVENRAIDPFLVDACFDSNLGVFDGDFPVEIEEPHPAYKYVTGVDWGRSRDKTVVATFRLPDWTCVAWQQYNKQPWPVQVSRAYKQWNKYGGLFVHDSTGLGTVVDDLIKGQTRSTEEFRRIIPITMSRSVNAAIFNEYVTAIEQNNVHYPMIGYAYDEHRYVTIDDLYGNGHAPDSFVAGALAWTQRESKLGLIATAISLPKQSTWNLSV